MQPTESAVSIVLPRADTVLGPHRVELAQSASWGVPAHVTVLYPFVPPASIDDDVLAGLAKAVATVPAFQVTLRQFGWFDDKVLWLAPEPAELFRALTAAVRQRFPDIAPYEGAHPDPVPHVTIGHDAPREVLVRAARAIEPHLPIREEVTAATLLQGSPEPDSWHTIAQFPLGG
jgi:2'-5' RNA ligase